MAGEFAETVVADTSVAATVTFVVGSEVVAAACWTSAVVYVVVVAVAAAADAVDVVVVEVICAGWEYIAVALGVRIVASASDVYAFDVVGLSVVGTGGAVVVFVVPYFVVHVDWHEGSDLSFEIAAVAVFAQVTVLMMFHC